MPPGSEAGTRHRRYGIRLPLASRGTRHPPRINPAADATFNGKVERSYRVDDQEFYQLLDRDGITDNIHLFNAKLKEWEDYYNYHRPHGALAGQTPNERLVAKARAGMSPAS